MILDNLDTEKKHMVCSDTNPNIFYEVSFINNEWQCNCLAFTYRKDLTKPCKHIKKLIEDAQS